uniref:Uncharacterized protein n=1 Tax=Arundo donax TaxID=35708 RepID=A0A0A9C9S7_ARUDO
MAIVTAPGVSPAPPLQFLRWLSTRRCSPPPPFPLFASAPLLPFPAPHLTRAEECRSSRKGASSDMA